MLVHEDVLPRSRVGLVLSSKSQLLPANFPSLGIRHEAFVLPFSPTRLRLSVLTGLALKFVPSASASLERGNSQQLALLCVRRRIAGRETAKVALARRSVDGGLTSVIFPARGSQRHAAMTRWHAMVATPPLETIRWFPQIPETRHKTPLVMGWRLTARLLQPDRCGIGGFPRDMLHGFALPPGIGRRLRTGQS